MEDGSALRLVCIGGGTGLSSLLSGIKQYTDRIRDCSGIIDIDNLSAIVSVSDDGGSSGRLIQEFDVPPPGDIRKLLVALSEADELDSLFEYRFSNDGDLGGHTVGNLLLTALTELNDGSFPKAIRAASKLLAVRGKIIPVSLNYTVLCAELADGEIVRGESKIPQRENREPIRRIFLEPRDNGKNHHPPNQSYECIANQEAEEAIHNSDVIAIGPGSLYTSIMPNLVVKGIAEAIRSTKAMKVYICNVMSQPGETDGYSVSNHVQAIVNHANLSMDYVIVNNQPAPATLINKYVQKELMEQFTRIKMHTEEALSALKEEPKHVTDSLLNLTKHISQLSDETKQMADPSKVQIFYDSDRDKLGDMGVLESDLIRDTVIVENGVPLTVIRHDPEKLVRTLIKILGNHPKLQEPI